MKTMISSLGNAALSREQMKKIKGGSCWDNWYNCVDQCAGKEGNEYVFCLEDCWGAGVNEPCNER